MSSIDLSHARPDRMGEVGIAGARTVGRTVDMARLGRNEQTEYKGAAGFFDGIARAAKALTGNDAVGLEVKAYLDTVRKDEAAQEVFIARAQEISGLESVQQVERLAGNNEVLKEIVLGLFDTRAKGHIELKDYAEQLGGVWSDAMEDMIHATQEDWDQYDSYREGATEARKKTFEELWGLWDIQDEVDVVHRLEYHAASIDQLFPRGMNGERRAKAPSLVGGPVRKVMAWFKGIGRETGERAAAVTGGISEARANALQNGFIHLRQEFLNRAGEKERIAAFAQGIITREEVKVGEAELEAGLTALGGQQTTEQPLPSVELAFYKDFSTGLAQRAGERFVAARKNWGDYATSGSLTGIVPARLVALAEKAGALGLDGIVGVYQGASGSVEVSVDTIESSLADFALMRLGEASVGRESMAEMLKQALVSGDAEAIVEAARQLRGAETVHERNAMLAARTKDVVDKTQKKPLLNSLPFRLAREGVDVALGGITVGKHAEALLGALEKRNRTLLAAEDLMEGQVVINEGTDDAEYQEAQREVTERIENLAEEYKVPAHFSTMDRMEEWKREGLFGLRKILVEGAALVVDPDRWNNDFWKFINEGSRRRTVSQVLGQENRSGEPITDEESQERSLLNRMVRVQHELDQTTEQAQEATSAENVDALLRYATCVSLSEAQKKWLTVEMKQMARRAKLDKFWEMSLEASAATAITAVVALLSGHQSEVAQQLSAKLGIDIGAAQAQLDTINRILKDAANVQNYTMPDASTVSQWAQEAGSKHAGDLQNMISKMEAQQASADTWSVIFNYASTALKGVAVATNVGVLGSWAVGGFRRQTATTGLNRPESVVR